MRRMFFALGLSAPLLGPALRADADVIFKSAPIAYLDMDDRFAHPYDVQGVVVHFSGFNMTLRIDGREYPVILHQGTIIKPTGTTLAPSMVLNIAGYWSGAAFYANRIVVLRF